MFIKIFLKEWQENVLIFFLATLMMLAMAFLNLSDLKELTLNFSGAFLLLFMPFAGLLIGSGGFYSEHKDKAWIFLMSRPIRKETLWLYKYMSLLSILLVIFLLFSLFKRFLPGFESILGDINASRGYEGILSYSTYILVPLFVFSIAYALSLLYHKQFFILFLTILICIGGAFLVQQYFFFLYSKYLYFGSLKGLLVLISLSFLGASVLTFKRVDFSQIKSKVWYFSWVVLVFLTLSFVTTTVWIAKGDLFIGSREFNYWETTNHKGYVYMQIYARGLMRYNPDNDKLEKLIGTDVEGPSSFSVAGGKVAFFKDKRVEDKWRKNLWIMNTDGTDKRLLIDTSSMDSPFYDSFIEGNCLLSSDGRQVAFVTTRSWLSQQSKKITIWWLDVDGSDLKSVTLPFPPFKNLQVIAWPADTDSFYLGLAEMISFAKAAPYKIVKIELNEKGYMNIIENVTSFFWTSTSPQHNFVALSVFDPKDAKIKRFMVLDLKSDQLREVASVEFFSFRSVRWSPIEDKFVFREKDGLAVYSLTENRIVQLIPLQGTFDWAAGGRYLAVLAEKNAQYFLFVFDENYEPIKDIAVPFKIDGTGDLWGLDNEVLVNAARKAVLWRVDLDTEEWKKVY